MFKLIFLLTGLIALTGIYDYTVKDINGNDIPLSNFRGKKILLVNTASNSKYTDQYESLEKLHQQYKDSLVIIAFPSNSFGHEADDNEKIKKFVNHRYTIHFILAQKTAIKGTEQAPLYSWLTQAEKNGMMSNEIKNDFYKFLIDESGKLVGIFTSSVDPMSEELQSAIRSN